MRGRRRLHLHRYIQILKKSLPTISRRCRAIRCDAGSRSLRAFTSLDLARRKKQLVVFRYSPTSRGEPLQYLPQWLLPRPAHLSDEPSRRPHCGISPQTAEYNTSCSLPLPQLPSDLLLGLPLAADLPRRHRPAADTAEDYDDSL